jgi:hypothetical protein
MNKNTAQALSFISGLTIAAVAVGVTVSKNRAIRTEIETQLNNVLSITKPLLFAIKGVAVSAGKAGNIANSAADKTANQAPNAEEIELNSQWDKARSAG